MIIYLLVALFVTALFSVAFSGAMGVFLSLVLGFILSVTVISFVDTLISGTNLGFGIAWRVFLFGGRRFFFGWSFLCIPLAVPAFLLFAVLLSPLWYYLDKYPPKGGTASVEALISQVCSAVGNFVDKIWLVFYFAGVGVMTALSVMTFNNPEAIYRNMHCGFWIVITVVLSALLLVIPARRYAKRDINNGRLAFFMGALALSFIAIVSIGVYSSTDRVYSISDASDMRIFGRAPQNEKTAFVLENDIDFGGERVRWYGKYNNFKGVFDGRGHTLSNFRVKASSKSFPYYASGLVASNLGDIRNLTLKDAEILIGWTNPWLAYQYFGVLTGVNGEGGRIENCAVIGCRYRRPTREKDYFANTVGSNIGESSGVVEQDCGYVD